MMSWLSSLGKIMILVAIGFAVMQSGLSANISEAIRSQDLDALDLGGVATGIFTTADSAKKTTEPSPYVTRTAEPKSTPTPYEEGYYERAFQWRYKGTVWEYTISIPKSTYNAYRDLDHTSRNYPKYISDNGSKKYLREFAEKVQKVGSEKGYSASDNVLNVIAFVQSLPYTSDTVTTGYDEYPRYPIETLVDCGGDCEDTALLTAGLLRALGYDVVLLGLPGHMAVGVKGASNLPGTYYLYHDVRYYYLETTGNGWGIGQIPNEYHHVKAKVIPV